MSDGRAFFSHSVPFLCGDSADGYIKRFFLTIGKYFKENQLYYTCNILFLKCGYVHPTYLPVLMLYRWDNVISFLL